MALSPSAAQSITPHLKHHEQHFTPVVLIDMMSSDNEHPVATRVFTFTNDEQEGVAAQMLSMVRSPGPLAGASATKALAYLRDHGAQLALATSNRWVSHQGDSIEVIVFRPGNEIPKITFEEEARQSRLTGDLDSLVETAGSIVATEDSDRRPAIGVTRRKYRLRDTRAVLKITAQEVAEGEKEGAADDEPPVITSIITGPSERVFLSLNAAFTKVRQVKYNSGEETFEHDSKPTEMLLGINYSMQDMFHDDKTTGLSAFLRGIYLGVLLEPTRRPFNQIATVAGFRHSPPPFESLFSLETVSPYIGLVWARDDVPSENSDHVKSRYGKRSLILGFALGLDRALGWLEGTQ